MQPPFHRAHDEHRKPHKLQRNIRLALVPRFSAMPIDPEQSQRVGSRHGPRGQARKSYGGTAVLSRVLSPRINGSASHCGVAFRRPHLARASSSLCRYLFLHGNLRHRSRHSLSKRNTRVHRRAHPHGRTPSVLTLAHPRSPMT